MAGAHPCTGSGRRSAARSVGSPKPSPTGSPATGAAYRRTVAPRAPFIGGGDHDRPIPVLRSPGRSAGRWAPGCLPRNWRSSPPATCRRRGSGSRGWTRSRTPCHVWSGARPGALRHVQLDRLLFERRQTVVRAPCACRIPSRREVTGMAGRGVDQPVPHPGVSTFRPSGDGRKRGARVCQHLAAVGAALPVAVQVDPAVQRPGSSSSTPRHWHLRPRRIASRSPVGRALRVTPRA